MLKKLCFFIPFVLVLSLAGSTYGAVYENPGSVILGDFERSLDGIRPDEATDEDLSFEAKGATLNDYALRVDYNPDFFWAFQIPLENINPNLVKNNTHVIYDVVWYDTDWIDKGIEFAKSEKIAFKVGYVWQEVGEGDEWAGYDPNFSEPGPKGVGWELASWPAGEEKLTVRLAWDYASDPDIDFSDFRDPNLFIATQATSSGPFYFDNIMLFNGNFAAVPTPRNTQTNVPVDTDLKWKAAGSAYFDVYFGTSYAEVEAADNSGDPCETDVYRAHQSDTTYNIPETLHINGTYYWRVDIDDGNDIYKGEVWSFETQSKAKDPYPADYATGVERQMVLSWRPGFEGAEHDAYFGTSFEEVNEADNNDPMGPTEVYRAHQNANDSNYTVPEYLEIEQTYYWRIDEVNDSNIYEGDVWRFTTLSARAKNPYPDDGKKGIYVNALKLVWSPGLYAVTHDVYLGTDYNDVAGATDDDTTGVFRGNQSETEYELSNLDLMTTYYWRIDGVNTSHPDVNWPGYVWSFTIPDYITIDDFEEYSVSDPEGTGTCPYYEEGDLRYVWLDGHVQKNPQGNCSGSTSAYNPLALEGSVGRLPGSRIIRTVENGGRSGYGISYFYDNNDVNNADFPPEQTTLEDHYSEILRYYAGEDGLDLTPDDRINADFSELDKIELMLYYRGNTGNAADPVYDRMYVGLRDTNNNYAYIDHPNPNAARIGIWQQWAVALSEFIAENPSMDLNHIRSVRIGFGKRFNKYNSGYSGGEGTVIFDEIRVIDRRFVTPAATPWLHVDGNKIKGPNGSVVVLRGVDMMDVGATELWYGGATVMIDRLTDNTDTQGSSPGWYTRVIRLPIYPEQENEFDSPWTFEPGDDDYYNELLRPVVDYCKTKNLYAIIDWHFIGDNTWDRRTETSTFWEYMAPRFANDSHVIFELYNEPGNPGSSETDRWISVRDDMQTWVDIIRTYAPNNLILVAGASWSRIIGPAATYPVSDPVGEGNIAYVSHFYPGWAEWKDHIITCAAVHPVFMTEWGFSEDAYSDYLKGTITDYGQPLMDFIEGLGISNSAWVASRDWEPQMFYSDWTLRCGESQMGCFVKDTLYLRRNDDQPSDWLYGDFTDDDIVDVNDLFVFCEMWLDEDCNSPRPDINGDCIINFHEYSLLAHNWLEEIE